MKKMETMIVEEQWDGQGDMIFTVQLATYDRGALDRLAEMFNVELKFRGEQR